MYDEGLLERCLDCLSAMDVHGVHHKNVFGMRGLMRGKKMFAAVGKEGMIVKVRASEFERALAKTGVARFMPGGETLGTWLELDPEIIADDPDLRDWLREGLAAI